MLNSVVTFALQQRIFVLVASVMLMAGGWRAFQELPVEAFPDVQDVQVQVITQALGQSPEDIELTITLPIEREMNGVPRLTRLRSVSRSALVPTGVNRCGPISSARSLSEQASFN